MVKLFQEALSVGLSKLESIYSSFRELQTGLWGMLGQTLTGAYLILFGLLITVYVVVNIDIKVVFQIGS